jgi:hypothetical protein
MPYSSPAAAPAETPAQKLARDVKRLGQTINPTFRQQVAMRIMAGFKDGPVRHTPDYLADLAIQRADALIARLAKDET